MILGYGYEAAEPEYPEPSYEDQCAMVGHPRGQQAPETMEGYCHCWTIYYPPAGEPHDEYSGHCANLIDRYVSLLSACMERREYNNVPESLRIDIGLELRHKTPAYLQSLINSLKVSGDQLSGDIPRLTEMQMDFYEKVGVHLSLDGDIVFQTFTARLGGDEDYIASEFEVRKPYSMGVLDDPSNLEVTRRAALFYTRLKNRWAGWETRRDVTVLLQELMPLFQSRPDLIDAAAAVINESSDMEVGAKRVLATVDSEPLPPAMMGGFL